MAPRKHSIGPASAADRAVSSGIAVIYARYSSHAQRDASIEQQIEECTAFAKRNNLFVLETYADKAVSGKTDRIGRNMLQALTNEEKLSKFCMPKRNLETMQLGGLPCEP